MDYLHTSEGYGDHVGTNTPRDTIIQIVFSVALGIGAFLTFCVSTPTTLTRVDPI